MTNVRGRPLTIPELREQIRMSTKFRASRVSDKEKFMQMKKGDLFSVIENGVRESFLFKSFKLSGNSLDILVFYWLADGTEGMKLVTEKDYIITIGR